MVLSPLLSVDPNTCSSSGSDKWKKFFNNKVTTLQPGSPCNDFKGYCDVFMRCRLVDADGPLARLKKAIFNPELYENIAEWIVVSVESGEEKKGETISQSLFVWRRLAPQRCLRRLKLPAVWTLRSLDLICLLLHVIPRLTGGQCC